MSLRQSFAGGCCAVVFAVFVLSVTTAFAQEDPFGGTVDPFGGAADPFAPNANAPGEKIDPERAARQAAERQRQRRRQQRQQLVGSAYFLYSQHYLKSGIDDRQRLDAGLSLLHYLLNDEAAPPELLDIVSRLAQSDWSLTAEDESPAARAKRLTAVVVENDDEYAGLGCFVRLNIPQLRANYERDSDEPWPLDWRAREEFFVQFAETFFASLRADDPAAAWKQRIDEDQQNKALYTAAYLGVLRGRPADSVDTTLISRYVAGAENPTERIRRLAQSLASVTAARDDVDDFARKRLREKLLEEMRASTSAVAGSIEALASTVQFGDQEAEVEPIMQVLLEYDSPRWFSEFCFRAKIGRQTQTKWYLRKPVAVNVRQRPALEALTLLKTRVELPLWIDESIAADTHIIDIDVAGPWLDALRAVTREAKLAIAPLEGGLLWVGPTEQRERAEQRLRTSRGKIPLDEGYVAKALQDETEIRFLDTDLTDVCDYLKDLHSVEIIAAWDFRDEGAPSITADIQALPLCLALTLILEDVELTWDAAEEVIVVGPPEFVAKCNRAAIETRRKRLLRTHEENATSSALNDLTTMEFIETPLMDVTDYLSDLHGVPVLRVDSKISDQPITKNLKGLPLDWALSLVVFDQQLDWFADEHAIYVGSIESIRAHQLRAEERTKRREKHRMLLGDKLQKPVKLEFIETPLTQVVRDLSELTGLKIKLDPASDGIESTTATTRCYHELPADVHLDLLTVELDMTWDVGEDGEIVVSKKGKAPRE